MVYELPARTSLGDSGQTECQTLIAVLATHLAIGAGVQSGRPCKSYKVLTMISLVLLHTALIPKGTPQISLQ